MTKPQIKMMKVKATRNGINMTKKIKSITNREREITNGTKNRTMKKLRQNRKKTNGTRMSKRARKTGITKMERTRIGKIKKIGKITKIGKTTKEKTIKMRKMLRLQIKMLKTKIGMERRTLRNGSKPETGKGKNKANKTRNGRRGIKMNGRKEETTRKETGRTKTGRTRAKRKKNFDVLIPSL